jgi:hypothetical protein
MSPDPAITIYNKLLLKDPSQVPTGVGDLVKKTAAPYGGAPCPSVR